MALLLGRHVARKAISVVTNHQVSGTTFPGADTEPTDFLPAYVRGVSFGSVLGLLAGFTAVAFPPAGFVFGGGTILVSTLGAAGLGGLMSGIAGAAFTHSRLNDFKEAIAAGELLILVDLPPERVNELEHAIRQADPSIRLMAAEPPAPVFG